MQRALALDNSPPLAVALPFFLAVPAFMSVISLLLLWYGPDAYASRWTPAAMAVTHLWVLGVLAGTMLGALFQILPVATGVRVVRSNCLSMPIFVLLSFGTLALATGFLTQSRFAFTTAMITLGLAFSGAVGLILTALWRQRKAAFKAAAEVLGPARLAVFSLLITVVLGLLLAGNHAQWWDRPDSAHSLHLLWGLAGWLGLLVIGMSYQLIPIFQATELYPAWMTRWLAPILCVLLVATSAGVAIDDQPGIQFASRIGQRTLLGGYLVYALCTLERLVYRKRPSPDVTTLFWLQGMLCLAAALTMLLLGPLLWPDMPELLPGLVLIVGFAASIVNGMLYKIIPFLLWFNLQRPLKQPIAGIPKVKDLLPEQWGTGQWIVHCLATLTGAGACIWPTHLAQPAAFLLLASAMWLGTNFFRATRLYLKARRSIACYLKKSEDPWQAGQPL